jgi:hypothetical protein
MKVDKETRKKELDKEMTLTFLIDVDLLCCNAVMYISAAEILGCHGDGDKDD